MKKSSGFKNDKLTNATGSIWKRKNKLFPEKQSDGEFDDIEGFLESLEPVEYPTQAEIDAERKKYFSLISQSETKPVSVPLVIRIKQMIGQVLNPNSMGQNKIGKENFVMSTVLVRIVLIGSLLFSLTTGAFAFTQNSLPDSPLYEAKLTIEDVSLSLMTDPAKLANKHLILAQNRVKEMVKLAQKGETPDAGVLLRLQQHLAYALHFAAQVQDGEMHQILNQAQIMAANQFQQLAQFQTQVGEKVGEPIGAAAIIMYQFQYQLSYGLGDPGGFKHQHNDTPDLAGLELEELDTSCILEGEYQYGLADGDGMHRYQNCIPEGEQYRYGPQAEQPGPGEPGGNPDCPDCDPEGDKNMYGPQPDQPGPGEPGGNPNCPDCDPDGDENKNGKP
jgi:hypothetical protein